MPTAIVPKRSATPQICAGALMIGAQAFDVRQAIRDRESRAFAQRGASVVALHASKLNADRHPGLAQAARRCRDARRAHRTSTADWPSDRAITAIFAAASSAGNPPRFRSAEHDDANVVVLARLIAACRRSESRCVAMASGILPRDDRSSASSVRRLGGAGGVGDDAGFAAEAFAVSSAAPQQLPLRRRVSRHSLRHCDCRSSRKLRGVRARQCRRSPTDGAAPPIRRTAARRLRPGSSLPGSAPSARASWINAEFGLTAYCTSKPAPGRPGIPGLIV